MENIDLGNRFRFRQNGHIKKRHSLEAKRILPTDRTILGSYAEPIRTCFRRKLSKIFEDLQKQKVNLFCLLISLKQVRQLSERTAPNCSNRLADATLRPASELLLRFHDSKPITVGYHRRRRHRRRCFVGRSEAGVLHPVQASTASAGRLTFTLT